jgi:hypothetical protein
LTVGIGDAGKLRFFMVTNDMPGLLATKRPIPVDGRDGPVLKSLAQRLVEYRKLLEVIEKSKGKAAAKSASHALHFLDCIEQDLRQKKRRPHEWYLDSAITFYWQFIEAQIHYHDFDTLVRFGRRARSTAKRNNKRSQSRRSKIKPKDWPSILQRLKLEAKALGGNTTRACDVVSYDLSKGILPECYGRKIKVEADSLRRRWNRDKHT